ncbi:MAG: sulfatase-like hydrolase/transferase, partial [Planctomycetes bacterium]|nr:sulfatase-like hydrolase/transferase [Planctomycetota bacterium]
MRRSSLASKTGRVVLVVLAALVIVAAALLLQRRDAFARARADAGSFTHGVRPFSAVVEPLFRAVSTTRKLDMKDVADFMARQRAAGNRDYGVMLDELIPNRRDYNVLCIAMDTVRFDHTGIGGYHRPTTPVLDALAKQSYVFERGYTPYPTSNYAYNSVLTGISAGASPIHGYRSKLDWSWNPEIYYPHLLSKAGLQSHGIFSFEMEHRRNMRYFGYIEHGFDVFNADQSGEGKMNGHQITASLRRTVLERTSRRFFAFAHYMEPHEPYETHRDFDFGDGTKDRYDSEIAFTDDQHGVVLKLLREQGLAENTIVAVFSDHGEALGEHQNATHDTSVFEEEIRIPFVLHVPGLPGGRVSEAASLIDLMPTIAKVLDVDDPERRMGQSLLPWMLEPGQHGERVIFAESYSTRGMLDYGEIRCVVKGDYKLIENVRQPQSDYKLYDLKADPDEARSLFDRPEHAELQAEMLGLLQAKTVEMLAYNGNPDDRDKAKVLERELRELMSVLLNDPDPAAAQQSTRRMRDLLLDRYASLTELADRIDPELIATIREKALESAIKAMPTVLWELQQILEIIPHPDNARYFRMMLEHPSPRVKVEGAIGLAGLGIDEGRSILETAWATVPDLPSKLEVAVALSKLGNQDHVAIYVPMLRGNEKGESTWEVGPLLPALTAAREPTGLRTIYERFTINQIHAFTLKRMMIDYAVAVQNEWADLVLLHLTYDSDPLLKEMAQAALIRCHGEAKAEDLTARYSVEREALGALLNGNAGLSKSLHQEYVAKWPEAPARIYLGLARSAIGSGDQETTREALTEMASRGNEEERLAAERMLAHLGQLHWFYQPDGDEWEAELVVKNAPEKFQRNRSFFYDVELTNRSKVFWMGGCWNFAPVLAADIIGAGDELFITDDRDRPVTRRRIENFLPLTGVAPGETIRMTVVGHVPSGYWEGGRVAFSFYQRGNMHLPADSGRWLVVPTEGVRPQ